MNEFKQGLLVGCGVGVLAFALGTAPAQAAEPSSRPMAPDPSGAMPQPKAEKTGIAHASVEVASIDKTARKITVKMPNGEKAQIQVPTDVQEFDKLKVGDKIDVDYMQSVALGFLPQGTKPSDHRARGRRAREWPVARCRSRLRSSRSTRPTTRSPSRARRGRTGS